MKVILISGKAQHGKDTFANMLKALLQDNDNEVLITHYGDLVKYVCKTFFQWNGEKDDVGRTLLQYVGTDVIRSQDQDYWVRFVEEMLRFFGSRWDYVLIPDCRFPNEIDKLKVDDFDVIHVRIVRTNFTNPLTKEQQNHPSEVALDHYGSDVTIENSSSLEHLEYEAKKFVGTYLSR